MPTSPLAVSRRALLAGTLGGSTALAATGLAGCSPGPIPDGPGATSPPTSTPSGAFDPAPSNPGADDAALVDEVVAALAVAHRTARVGVRAYPGLAARLRPVILLHAEHAAGLGAELDRTAGTGRLEGRSETQALVVRRVDRTEARLQSTLVAASTSASSGALALTLASMAAAVAQQRTARSQAGP